MHIYVKEISDRSGMFYTALKLKHTRHTREVENLNGSV